MRIAPLISAKMAMPIVNREVSSVFGTLRAPLGADTVSFGKEMSADEEKEARMQNLREYCFEQQAGELRPPKTEKEIAFNNTMQAYLKVYNDPTSTKSDFQGTTNAMWEAYNDLLENEIYPSAKKEGYNDTTYSKEYKEKSRWLHQTLKKEFDKLMANDTHIAHDFYVSNEIGSLSASILEYHFDTQYDFV